MNKFVSLRTLAAAAVVLGAVGAAASAHARSDVQFTIGINSPGVYVQPAPVYVQPRQYYVQPAPVYYYGAPRHYGHGHRHHRHRGHGHGHYRY